MFCLLSTDTSINTHIRLKINFTDLAYDSASVVQWENDFTAEVRCNLIILPHIYPQLLSLNFSVEQQLATTYISLQMQLSVANYHNRRGKVGKKRIRVTW